MKVFLGGTCNGSTWREKIIPMLDIDYFNPVVDNWTEECQKREIEERENCDFCLYTITPKMKGVYSIAEVVDDSNKRPDKTIFVLLETEDGGNKFNETEWKSLVVVSLMVTKNGGRVFHSLEDAAFYMNNVLKSKSIWGSVKEIWEYMKKGWARF